MKKCLFFLTALALLVVGIVFAVSAENQTQSDAVFCDRCAKYVPSEEWMEWTATGGDVNKEGHYYLADTFTKQESTVKIPALKFVCLDLRGNSWITEGVRTMTIDGDFSIIDSVGGGLILTTGAHLIDGGFASVSNVGALNIYGGTMRRIVRDDITIYHGGLIDIAGGAVNIYGGTVAGGVVKGIAVSGTVKTPRGGNIYMAGGTLNISGGALIGGMNLSGASSNPQGGSIYATEDAGGKSARISISGGSVAGGYSDWDGGNIYLANAILTLSGNGTITGGHAIRNGGNIGVTSESAVVTLSGGTVNGGVAGGALNSNTSSQGYGGGGNLYGYKGTLNIAGATIDGDIRLDSTMTAVNLSGVSKVGLGKSAGMMIPKGMKLNVSDLEAGSEIFVRTYGGAFTNEIPADRLETVAACFKGAVRTELTVDTEAGTINAAQGSTGYCPHCYDASNPQTVTWTAVSSNSFETAGHYYLSGSMIGTSNFAFYVDCVLDLNGYTVQRTGARVILAAANVDLDIMDSVGGGRVIGTGTNATYGAFQISYSKNTLTLHSGNLIFNSGDATVVTPAGGMIYCNGSGAKINIKGGVINGGQLKADSPTGGGNIYNEKTDTVMEISGGIIKNGNSGAANGGNIYSAGKVTVSGGVIIGGIASGGGNIYTSSDLIVSGGTVWGGTSSGTGGNIYANKITATGGVIGCGVSSANSGGNIRLGKTVSTISGDAVIVSGKANSNAGNIYCVEGMTLNVQGGLIAGGVAKHGGNIRMNAVSCTLNITGGVIAMGKATEDGGNVYVNNGTVNMTGGVVVAGYATDGGNFFFNNYVYGVFKDDGNTNTLVPSVCYGTAYGGKGGNIHFNCDGKPYYLQLGNCDIHGGYTTRQGDNIYLTSGATIEILPEFAQSTSIYVPDHFFSDDGLSLDDYNAYCNGVYSGSLYLENDSGLPKIITSASDPTLVIGQAALIMKDGTAVWFGSNEAAMAAYTDQVKYIQPGSGDLNLPSGEYIIDLAGSDVVVKGDSTASFYCFDTVNVPPHNFWGTVTVKGPKLLNEFTYTVEGNLYLMIEEDYYDMYSFHRLDMEVIGATVRPDTAGFYYTSKYTCDSKIFELVESFGIAVSIKDMPGADFVTDPDTLYTQLPVSELSTSDEYNSIIINNILKTDADNASRGTTGIYGMPYMVLGDGSEEGNVRVVVANGVCYSLKDAFSLVDRDQANYYANKPALETFYQKWETVMKDWEFTNIGVKPQDDDTFRILMIGNSFCSYYTGELYGLLMENLPEGATSVEVYNLYASGRTMTAHYNLWANGSPGDYDLFRVDENGRIKLQPNGGWTLEEALAVANWDYISLQGKPSSGSYATEADLDPMCQELNRLAEPLFARIHEMFPYTKLLWHRTWNQEVGRVTDSGFVYTEDYNSRYDPGMQYVCDYMTEVFDQDKPYDLVQVNSGAAWTEARRLNETLDLLPYGGLCAGNGRNTFGDGRANSGDGQHDGDIGGGQMLNAYMWYMTITGDGDLSDNNFKPDYELSDALINMLKQAAMTIYNAAE